MAWRSQCRTGVRAGLQFLCASVPSCFVSTPRHESGIYEGFTAALPRG